MSQGQMRQQAPAPDQIFDYRVETQGETVRVSLDGDEIELSVTTKDAQEGWCRTSDGSLHSFCWTWTGNSLQLWVDGNVFIFEKVESRRQVNRESPGIGGDIGAQRRMAGRFRAAGQFGTRRTAHLAHQHLPHAPGTSEYSDFCHDPVIGPPSPAVNAPQKISSPSDPPTDL